MERDPSFLLIYMGASENSFTEGKDSIEMFKRAFPIDLLSPSCDYGYFRLSCLNKQSIILCMF